jgi:TolB-like protein
MRVDDDTAFRFEGYILDLRRGALRADNLGDIELRPKSFELLRYLVEHAGRLVPKNELLEAIWPDVVVTDESLTRCVSDVRSALSDSDQNIIKTVPRRGYLFAATVARDDPSIQAADSMPRVRPTTAPSPETTTVPPLSLVVLPFINLGGEAEDGFIDAVVDILTTDLSRVSGMFVIARNTAFMFKDRQIDARQIGRSLGVRYVVEGSIQTGPNTVRVIVQLIDGESGAHLWADRFDKPRGDLFAMEDEIASRLTRGLVLALLRVESRRAEQSHGDDAHVLALRGWALLQQPISLARAREARQRFEAALYRDADHFGALIGLASTLQIEADCFASDDRPRLLQQAEAAITRALALSPTNATAHYIAAEIHALAAPDRAMRELEIAQSLGPQLPRIHARLGFMKIILGRPQETEAHIEDAIRLLPHDPELGTWQFWRGLAELYQNRLEKAAAHLRVAVETNPEHGLPWFYLAAAEYGLGHPRAAANARAAGQRLIPGFSVGKLRAAAAGCVKHDVLAQREPVWEALLKAGVPL